MNKIGIIGAGRLGLCLGLNLERCGYQLWLTDVSKDRVDSINNKTVDSEEPFVNEYLSSATQISAAATVEELFEQNVDFVFVCVPTPSLPDGKYDHSYIESVMEGLLDHKEGDLVDVVINATTMPGYCEELAKRIENTRYKISYNPEFIAQGSIIMDQQRPDQVLIGEADSRAGERIEKVYNKLCLNEPAVHRMDRTSAEITKLAVNCFLTTKIAFANSIGDLAIAMGANQDNVLNAIGSDSRIGSKYLGYGFGFGGPCLPRDNRALSKAGEDFGQNLHISEATDMANKRHLDVQFEQYSKLEEPIVFDYVTYKPGTDILEEAQQLALAVKLMESGKRVVIKGATSVLEELRSMYGSKFEYLVDES